MRRFIAINPGRSGGTPSKPGCLDAPRNALPATAAALDYTHALGGFNGFPANTLPPEAVGQSVLPVSFLAGLASEEVFFVEDDSTGLGVSSPLEDDFSFSAPFLYELLR